MTLATFRSATEGDVETIYKLILALAVHHGQSEYVSTTPIQLRRDGFGKEPKFSVLLAEKGSEAVGFFSYTVCYSIWCGESFMQIDDLFVLPEYRSGGVGVKLMQKARGRCKKMGLRSIKWQVELGNNIAQRFYRRLGATYHEKGLFHWDVSER